MVRRVLDSRPLVFLVALAFMGLVAYVDHLTGTELVLPVFYLLPIMLVAWRVGLWPAVALSALGACVTLVDDVLYGSFANAGIPYWNAAVRTATNLLAADIVWLLRGTNRRLRAVEALRQDLTNMLVHDLKNPLVSAAMALDLFRRRHEAGADAGKEGSVEQEELLRIATESNERLRRLIEDILDVARAEGAEMPLSLEEVDLGEVVRTAVTAAVARASRAELKLDGTYPSEPLVASLDPDKIRRVMDNLLENAFKYTRSGGVVAVQVSSRDGQALVRVRDDGEGIPPDLQRMIFEKFGQAEAVREGRRMSVGLGLAFCKLTVEAHGGRIWVESTPAAGATFTFALPLPNHQTT